MVFGLVSISEIYLTGLILPLVLEFDLLLSGLTLFYISLFFRYSYRLINDFSTACSEIIVQLIEVLSNCFGKAVILVALSLTY